MNKGYYYYIIIITKIRNTAAETLFPVNVPVWLHWETYDADAKFVFVKEKCF